MNQMSQKFVQEMIRIRILMLARWRYTDGVI